LFVDGNLGYFQIFLSVTLLLFFLILVRTVLLSCWIKKTRLDKVKLSDINSDAKVILIFLVSLGFLWWINTEFTVSRLANIFILFLYYVFGFIYIIKNDKYDGFVFGIYNTAWISICISHFETLDYSKENIAGTLVGILIVYFFIQLIIDYWNK